MGDGAARRCLRIQVQVGGSLFLFSFSTSDGLSHEYSSTFIAFSTTQKPSVLSYPPQEKHLVLVRQRSFLFKILVARQINTSWNGLQVPLGSRRGALVAFGKPGPSFVGGDGFQTNSGERPLSLRRLVTADSGSSADLRLRVNTGAPAGGRELGAIADPH